MTRPRTINGHKSRRLWLDIHVLRRPRGMTRGAVLEALLTSTRNRGSFSLPAGLDVEISWRNKLDAPMRRGKWSEEMRESEDSSPGFSLAVESYLIRKQEQTGASQ